MSIDPELLGSEDEDLARVARILASATDEDRARVTPPADLWDSIAARLGDDEPTVLAEPDPSDDSPAGVAPVVPLDAHRRSRWVRMAAAAAVVVLAAGTVGVLASDREDATQELVASIDLEVLRGPATATAELVAVDGDEVLRIELEGLGTPPEGRHYELWLIDPDVTDPRSLGEVPAGATEVEVPVPDGIDADRYPIVDINVQEDGVEEHSGLDTSILRGTLA